MKNLFFALIVGVALIWFLKPDLWDSLSVSPVTSVSPSPSLAARSAAAQKFKLDAEILHEMIVVVLNREPAQTELFKVRGEFGNWVDTLNQGASFEGVYHGLVQSEDYRKLENLVLSSAALKAQEAQKEELGFLQELARLAGVRFQPQPQDGISFYAIKRSFAEDALSWIAALRGGQQAQVYAQWVFHMGQKNINFGIALRNKQDLKFHEQWALTHSEDEMKWEILNRLHRYFNHFLVAQGSDSNESAKNSL